MKKSVCYFALVLLCIGIVCLLIQCQRPQEGIYTAAVQLENGTVIYVRENFSEVDGEIERHGTLTVANIELAEDGELIIPESVGGLPITEFSARIFNDSQKLTKISLPDTLIQFHSAFSLCTNLETIDIGKSTVTVNYANFQHCVNLKNINVSPDNTRYYFENGCLIERETRTLVMGLSSCIIPESIDSIGEFAFMSMLKAEKLSLPEGLKSIGNNAFEGCDIQEFYIPDGVETIGSAAFASTSISVIELPSALQEIPYALFWGCNALEKVIIGENVSAIDEQAFISCSNLSSIIVDPDNPNYYSDQNCLIEKGTDRLVRCGNEATLSSKIKIIGEASLTETSTLGTQSFIIIPEGVQELESYAICGYEGDLSAVYIPSSVKNVAEIAIVLMGTEKNLTVYCEASSKPDGWDDNWLGNADETKVVWDAKLSQLKE